MAMKIWYKTKLLAYNTLTKNGRHAVYRTRDLIKSSFNLYFKLDECTCVATGGKKNSWEIKIIQCELKDTVNNIIPKYCNPPIMHVNKHVPFHLVTFQSHWFQKELDMWANIPNNKLLLL